MSQITYLTKITTAKLGFDIKALRKACEKKPAALYNVYGIATRVEYGSGEFGAWVRFLGQFEANNSEGELVRAGKLFLPDNITSILESQVVSGKGEESFRGVYFVMEIGVKASDLPIGYEFTVKDLTPPDVSSDFLTRMREEHAQKLLAGKK